MMLKTQSRSLVFLTILLVLVLTLACNFANQVISASVATSTPEAPSQTPSPLPPTPTPTDEEVVESLPTPSPTSEAQPESPLLTLTPTVVAAPVESCEPGICMQPGTFILSRPIGPEGRSTIDHSRRYGEYRTSTRRANRGVQFLNSLGTPVRAVADGVVVVAGDDSQTNYGYYANAFGNLIILEHDLPEIGVPVYTLYAHLSQIDVRVDDQVSRGDEIGLVGNTGDVEGSTLYFEIRLGENNYNTPQNPELWLEPLMDESGTALGALAGLILDEDGEYITVPNIVVERLAGPGLPAEDTIYLETYNSESMMGLPIHGESFALGGLPAGEYQITFMMDGFQQAEVQVEPGKLTFVSFEVE